MGSSCGGWRGWGGGGWGWGRGGFGGGWGEYVDDLRLVLRQPEVKGDAPLFVLGHSHGGLVVIAAAIEGVAEVANLRGVMLTNPYLRNGVPVGVHRRFAARVIDPFVPWARFSSRVRVDWLTSDPRMQQETIDDPLCHKCATPRWFLTMREAQRRAMERASTFRLPMLLMMGERDQVAHPEACRRFFAAAGSADKSLKVYPEMVHELLRESARERVFGDVLEWMGQRMGSRKVAAST